MLQKDTIEESYSPYDGFLWVVPKKKDASGKRKWRVAVNFRKMNEHTPQNNHPIPNDEKILERLGGAHYISTFDLASGFYQIMLEEDWKKRQLSLLLTDIFNSEGCQ